VSRRKPAPGRDKLLETAGALFAAAGFDGVTTKQLAADAGLSIGALYHHFPTKHAAYCAALEWGVARVTPPDPAVFAEAGNPGTQLDMLVTWFCSVISASTIESQLLRLELLDPHLEIRISNLAPFSLAFARFQVLMHYLAPDADADLVVAAIVSLSFGFSRLGGLQLQVPEFAQRMQEPAAVARVVTQLIFPRSD
jgi:AcrR family transcriptional regulator